MKKQQKCYIYTRVSTSMQVDGYSLDAQKDKLKKYADYQEMSIVGEYSDEGKSGKSVESRPQFKQMLSDIENGKTMLIMCWYLSCQDLEEMQQMFYHHCRKCRIMGLILSV